MAGHPKERRTGDGRREEDREAAGGRGGLRTMSALVWALVGSVVVLYLFFVALGGVDPADAKILSVVVLALAVLWLAHAWRRLLSGGGADRGNRERRGF